MHGLVPAIAGGALLVSSIVTSMMRRWSAKLGFVDVPNARSSHSLPTARGGGIAIVLAFFLSLLVLYFYNLIESRLVDSLIFAGGAVALVGLVDDKFPLPAYARFIVHISAGIVAVLLIGGLPEAALSAWSLHGKLVGMSLAALAILWGINLFNFMDGIDGIAGIEAVFIAGAAAFLNWAVGGTAGVTAAMICLVAACIGFLIFNWPPASIFMGDVGSGFLGFTLVLLTVYASKKSRIPLEVWPILGGVFIVDATVTLVTRILRGDRWREAHHLHAYQHLARRMGGHRPVTLVVLAIDLLWLLPWACYGVTEGTNAGLCMAAALLPLVAAAIVLRSGRHPN
jgi:Fuc2NAc and GlcNAc transferase